MRLISIWTSYQKNYLFRRNARMRKTKIVCTIGPASESVETLTQLMEAGMNVARLNFSHGDFAEHGERIRNIKEAAEKAGKTIAILLDTKGPEIRTGNFKNGEAELVQGDTVYVTMKEIEGTAERFTVTRSEERRVGKECREGWAAGQRTRSAEDIRRDRRAQQ